MQRQLAALSLLLLLQQLIASAYVADALARTDNVDDADQSKAERPLRVGMSLLRPARRLAQPLVGFSWSDCGSADASVRIVNVSVSPNPLKLSADITVSFSASVRRPVATPVQVAVQIQKKIFGAWISVPCVEQLGSCTYSDVCSLAPAKCPPPLVAAKVPCRCPVSPGNYSLPPTTFDIHEKIPSFLESGDYKLHAVGTSGSQQVFCVNSQVTLD